LRVILEGLRFVGFATFTLARALSFREFTPVLKHAP
jgi:hypothetical protein